MKCKFNTEVWNGIFAIPTAIVDQYIRLAGGAQLKAVLWMLRHNGEEHNPKEMSLKLGLSEPDTLDAIRYWANTGLIIIEDENRQDLQIIEKPEPVNTTEKIPVKPVEIQATPSEETAKTVVLPAQLPHYSSKEIAERTKENPDIKFLLSDAQIRLGKTISPSEAGTITALIDWLRLPADVILMIISYCISIGKPSVRYIEKVAISWADQGINTHEKADDYMRSLEKGRTVENKIKKMMGIGARTLTTSEETNIKRWTNDWHFEIDMITLAYERAVDKTGIISFPYINSILRSWYQNGIKTIEQAQAEKNGFKHKTVQPKSEPSYDLDEYERALLNESPRLKKQG